jgi:hypothetical protein
VCIRVNINVYIRVNINVYIRVNIHVYNSVTNMCVFMVFCGQKYVNTLKSATMRAFQTIHQHTASQPDN